MNWAWHLLLKTLYEKLLQVTYLPTHSQYFCYRKEQEDALTARKTFTMMFYALNKKISEYFEVMVDRFFKKWEDNCHSKFKK